MPYTAIRETDTASELRNRFVPASLYVWYTWSDSTSVLLESRVSLNWARNACAIAVRSS